MFQKLQGSSSVRSKRNVKETGSNIRSGFKRYSVFYSIITFSNAISPLAVSKTFHELDKSYHNAQGANRLKRATGDQNFI